MLSDEERQVISKAANYIIESQEEILNLKQQNSTMKNDINILVRVGRMYLYALNDELGNEFLTSINAIKLKDLQEVVERYE